MTRVYVDEKEVLLPPSSFGSLQAIVKQIEAHVLPPDMVIRQILVDGVPLFSRQSEEPGSPPQLSAAASEKVEIATGTLKEIARDSIQEALSYLDRVEAAIPSIVTGFRVAPGPEAFGQLKQLLDGFYWIHLLQDRIGAAFKSPSKLPGYGTEARDCLLRSASIFGQLVEAQEKNDYVLIADLLEFEVVPTIPGWKSLLAALQELAEKEH